MDSTYQKLSLPFEQSLTVLSTVLSLPDRDTVILDAGMKAISVERECPAIQGMSGVAIMKLSEEHATAHSNSAAQDLKPGVKVNLIPSHCCTTVNLYDQIYAVRNGRVEAIWQVAARGAYY
jgi:D-serine deaminase-like pyridoxal phosphate-dependent protein